MQVPSMLGTIAGAASKGASVMANNYSGTDQGGYGGNQGSTGSYVGGALATYSLGKMNYP